MRWPRKVVKADSHAYFPSWCNGNAGLTAFWFVAAEFTGREDLHDLALRSAQNCWDEPAGVRDLCCGTAGQAYAMLLTHRETGDAHWLAKAEGFAQLAAEGWQPGREPIGGLYKGWTGLAALLADLQQPNEAAMPLFHSLPLGKRVHTERETAMAEAPL